MSNAINGRDAVFKKFQMPGSAGTAIEVPNSTTDKAVEVAVWSDVAFHAAFAANASAFGDLISSDDVVYYPSGYFEFCCKDEANNLFLIAKATGAGTDKESSYKITRQGE